MLSLWFTSRAVIGALECRGVEKFVKLFHLAAAKRKNVAPFRTRSIAVLSHSRGIMAQDKYLVAVGVEFLRREFAELQVLGNCPEEIAHLRTAFAHSEGRKILFASPGSPLDIRRAGTNDRLDIAARKSRIHALHESNIRLAHCRSPRHGHSAKLVHFIPHCSSAVASNRSAGSGLSAVCHHREVRTPLRRHNTIPSPRADHSLR